MIVDSELLWSPSYNSSFHKFRASIGIADMLVETVLQCGLLLIILSVLLRAAQAETARPSQRLFVIALTLTIVLP